MRYSILVLWIFPILFQSISSQNHSIASHPSSKLSVVQYCKKRWHQWQTKTKVNQQPDCSDTTFHKLPSDLQHLMLHQVDSLMDVAVCRKVCKSWAKTLDTFVLDISSYSSLQDFLLRVEQGSVKAHSSWISKALNQSPFTADLCSVEQELWFKAILHIGHVEALEQWFRRHVVVADHRTSLLASLEKLHTLMYATFKFKQERVDLLVEWYIAKLQELQKMGLDSQVQEWSHQPMLHVVLEFGSMKLLMHPFIQSLLNHASLTSVSLLSSAAKNPHRDVCLKYLVQQLLDMKDTWHLKRALIWSVTECRTCVAQDIQSLLHRLPLTEHSQVMNSMFMQACTLGHLDVVQVLLSCFPHFTLTDEHIQHALSSGHSHLLTYLQSRHNYTVNMDVIVHVGNRLGFESLSFVNQFILYHTVSKVHAQSLVTLYTRRACGGKEDIKAFMKLSADSPLDKEHLMSAIQRPDLLATPFLAHDRRQPKLCLKHESTQLVEYILKHVQPTQEHLNAALKRGRLDLVELVHKAHPALDLNASFLISSTIMTGLQETELLKFIMNQSSSRWKWSKLHAKKKMKQLFTPDISRKYDCYHRYFKE